MERHTIKLKVLPKRTLLSIVFLLGLTIFVVLFSYFLPKNSIRDGSALLVENAAVITHPKQLNSELPTRLKIPKINIDASVEYVGLTPDGAMDVPKGRVNVAWFNLGPSP